MFATTRWSLVLAARDRQTPAAEAALAELCAAYWYPLDAFIRIVTVHDFGESGGHYFFLMEYIGPRSFDLTVRRFRRITRRL